MTNEDEVTARRDLRRNLLIAMYRLTNGIPGPTGGVTPEAVAERIGIPDESLRGSLEILKQQGLIEWITFSELGLTINGVAAAEHEIAGRVDGNVLVGIEVGEHRLIEAWLRDARDALDQGQIESDPDTLAEIQAQLDTIAAQLRSPRPLRRVLSAVLGATGALLGSVTANVIAQRLTGTVPGL